MADKDVAAASSADIAVIAYQSFSVSRHTEVRDVTERVVEMSRHHDDATVAAAKAQYACPARQETFRAVINSTWAVGAGIVGVIGALKHFFKVEDGILYAALAVLAGLEGMRRWKK